jgi:Asp-tRNA(Asn)/Glu-tRNA(Gln) amidotransferase A subunit family amidase
MYENMKDYCVFVGTDTTGCVRIPASLCGIFGFRPSHGAISTIGVLPNAQSLDTIGKMHSFVLFLL